MTKPFRPVEFPPVALTGKMRAGKSQAARYLVEKYGYTEFAFGDALKDDFHRRYPEIPHTPKPRVGYQMHGQLMRRLFGEDVWVRACFRDISESHDAIAMSYPEAQPPVPLISDVRQPNEFDRCRSENFVIIRVNCPDELRLERARAAGDNFTEADIDHETEQHVSVFAVDYDVHNTGSLDELYAQIDEIMAKITEVGD